MCQADLIPWTGNRRELWLKFEDLERCATRDANPSDLAARLRALNLEEAANAVGRRIGYTNERATEDVPVELNRLVEVGNCDADVAERACSHVNSSNSEFRILNSE